jgi:hypothetical protein
MSRKHPGSTVWPTVPNRAVIPDMTNVTDRLTPGRRPRSVRVPSQSFKLSSVPAQGNE